MMCTQSRTSVTGATLEDLKRVAAQHIAEGKAIPPGFFSATVDMLSAEILRLQIRNGAAMADEALKPKK